MSRTFSVITINYNNLNGLKRTLRSVQEQTARDQIELIVIDGGSTDGGAEFLRSAENLIDLLVIEKDGGIYDAMNKGMRLATGKYVWFVNSGDAIHDSGVAEKLIPFTTDSPGVIYGDTMFIDQSGHELGLISRLKPQPLPEKLGPGSFRFGMNVCHQSFIARRDLCPDYDLKYRQAADIDWIIRILKGKPESVRVPFVVADFETGGSSYQHEKRAWKERFSVLRHHYGTVANLINHVWILDRRLLFNIGIKIS